MEIEEVSFEQYDKIINHPYFVFEGANFNQINSAKCDSVFYLLFKDVHYRIGIIGGIRNKEFLSPFSAPFGGFSFLRHDLRLSYIEEAIELLIDWSKRLNLSGISITLHPYFNNESQLSKLINCLYRKSFKIDKIDLNYFLNLENFDNNYINLIWKEARNNLRKSFLNQLNFKCCESFDEMVFVFDIIRKNKEAYGYPLHLTFDQIIETSNIIDSDFFLVRDMDFHPVASAIVFHVSSEIVQVIYWGDLPEFRKLKAMNFLSFKIFEHYKRFGKKIVDLGPSTNDSVPNFGLCVFKESIGCDITTKFSFSIRL